MKILHEQLGRRTRGQPAPKENNQGLFSTRAVPFKFAPNILLSPVPALALLLGQWACASPAPDKSLADVSVQTHQLSPNPIYTCAH